MTTTRQASGVAVADSRLASEEERYHRALEPGALVVRVRWADQGGAQSDVLASGAVLAGEEVELVGSGVVRAMSKRQPEPNPNPFQVYRYTIRPGWDSDRVPGVRLDHGMQEYRFHDDEHPGGLSYDEYEIEDLPDQIHGLDWPTFSRTLGILEWVARILYEQEPSGTERAALPAASTDTQYFVRAADGSEWVFYAGMWNRVGGVHADPAQPQPGDRVTVDNGTYRIRGREYVRAEGDAPPGALLLRPVDPLPPQTGPVNHAVYDKVDVTIENRQRHVNRIGETAPVSWDSGPTYWAGGVQVDIHGRPVTDAPVPEPAVVTEGTYKIGTEWREILDPYPYDGARRSNAESIHITGAEYHEEIFRDGRWHTVSTPELARMFRHGIKGRPAPEAPESRIQHVPTHKPDRTLTICCQGPEDDDV